MPIPKTEPKTKVGNFIVCSLLGIRRTDDRALSFMFTTEKKPLGKGECNFFNPRFATIPDSLGIPMSIDISVTEVISRRIGSLNYTLILAACKSN